MSNDDFLNEFPVEKSATAPIRASEPPIETAIDSSEPLPGERSRFLVLWEQLSQAGLAEITIRLGTNILLIALILLVAWGMRELYSRSQVVQNPKAAVLAAELPSPTPTEIKPVLPDFNSARMSITCTRGRSVIAASSPACW